MATEHIQFRFNGNLAIGQLTGRHSMPYNRVMTRVQLTLGAAGTSDCKVQAQIDGVTQAQVYTIPAGSLYAEITVAGNGLAVTSHAALGWILVDGGDAFDLDLLADFESATAAITGENPDCGLGVLSELKAHILSESLTDRGEYDAALQVIGLGVAALLERHCNRTFKRLQNAVEDFPGDRDVIQLSRCPIESIASIGLQEIGDLAFTTQTGIVDNVLSQSGVAWLTCELGTPRAIIRATYTGGYWYDDSADQSGSLPSGATLLPPEVKLAWLTQCAHLWSQRDNLGVGLTDKPGARSKLEECELLPLVKQLLQHYVRYQLA